MEGWLTVIQRIVLLMLISLVVVAIIFTAINNWANDNKDGIKNPVYTYYSYLSEGSIYD